MCGPGADPIAAESALLSTLLSVDDWHRGVSIRTQVLASTGRPRVLYVPDHRSLELDAADAPAIESAAIRLPDEGTYAAVEATLREIRRAFQ